MNTNLNKLVNRIFSLFLLTMIFLGLACLTYKFPILGMIIIGLNVSYFIIHMEYPPIRDKWEEELDLQEQEAFLKEYSQKKKY